ncbi:hypothetical protein BLD50_06950 [Bacillus cereus]|nr:hypothetical protein BLD50_06950 [Bacillus cereus]
MKTISKLDANRYRKTGEELYVDKSWSGNSTQLLQEIDWKMSRIESILQQVSIDGLIEESYEIHEMLIKVSQLLLILQQDLKMTPLAKGLHFQLQSIQEQYNRLFDKGEMNHKYSK